LGTVPRNARQKSASDFYAISDAEIAPENDAFSGCALLFRVARTGAFAFWVFGPR
jgi:hypothetical protein